MRLEDKVDELKPEYYFDLSKFKHKKLFDNVDYVWDALKRLPDYLNQHEKGIKETAKIHPTAIINGDVYIGERTVVEAGAVINGPAVIGDDCLIQSSAEIRGNALIGNLTRIGSTEVTNSILLGGISPAKRDLLNLAHFNYIGYSIVGYGVLFGGGARTHKYKDDEHIITSSVRKDWKPVVVKINDKKYETGLAQFGAVIGDKAIIGTNTCLNPGSLIGKKSQIINMSYWTGFLPSNKYLRGKFREGIDYEILELKE